MKSKLSERSQAFTIIEVMIVLVVVGLIMLVVLVVVPTLQRNSRNNNYRNEAARIVAGTQEFISNNGGALPHNDADGATILGNANTQKINFLTVLNPGTSVPKSANDDFALSHAILETAVACGSVTTSSVAPARPDSKRAMILIYGLENPNGYAYAQCVSF